MSAVDMSMIDHIPDMIENGVDSLRNRRTYEVYSLRINSNQLLQGGSGCISRKSEQFEAIKQDLVDEMWKVANVN